MQKRIESLEHDKSGLESENEALRALRESYKRRFVAEEQCRTQLQDQVAVLKSYLEDTQQKNRELKQERQDQVTLHRQQRNQYLAKEEQWKHKIERIKRDFDQLWTKYKTSQSSLKESNTTVESLRAELDALRKSERKWAKEKTYLTGQVQHYKGSFKTMKATLKGPEKVKAPSST
ncbi:MAG: hypothetical protein SGARI_004582 [Bacillariaceae sp.]